MHNNLYDQKFFDSCVSVNQRFKTIIPQTILWPKMNLISQGDVFYQKLWNMIDNANTYIWIVTYAFDNSEPARTTLKKLIEAQQRGVNVCLLVDDLNQRASWSLRYQLMKEGGTFKSLRPVYKLWNFVTRENFQRHHEKLTVIDDEAIIGSSNLETNYGGIKYGEFLFIDINMYLKNICLKEIREHIANIANNYQIKLNQKYENNSDILGQYNLQYPNSEHNPKKIKLIKTNQLDSLQIQETILDLINKAQQKIVIVQPYYYPIKKIEKALLQALDRGVKVELITAAKRDQPIYAKFKNILLMRRLIDNGMKALQYNDKFLHAKLYAIDDKIYTTGSFNNDKWSWNINYEVNILIEDEEETQKVMQMVDVLRRKTKTVEKNPNIGYIRLGKIIFWDTFLMISEWCSNQRRQFKSNKHHQEYQESIQNSNNIEDKWNKMFTIFHDWDNGISS